MPHINSSLHRLTFKSQLNSAPSLLSYLPLLSEASPSIVISAGLGSSLYSIGSDPTENTVSVVVAQQYLDYCLLIPFRGNLFTESVACNELLLWLLCSGFQASCNNTVVQLKRSAIRKCKNMAPVRVMNFEVSWPVFKIWNRQFS
jgi:hypothetical protein